MKDELEQQLERDFPFMKRDRNGEKNIYQEWGCECDNGWYDLIYELCQKISDRFERDGKEPDIIVLQVKEKFAALRFYYKFEGLKDSIQALDFLESGTSIRFSPEDSNSDKSDDETAALRKDIRKLVNEYEQKSKTICEKCGAVGEVRADLPCIRTLCDNCYGESLKKNEEAKKKREAHSIGDFLD